MTASLHRFRTAEDPPETEVEWAARHPWIFESAGEPLWHGLFAGQGVFRILADASGEDKAVRRAIPPTISRLEASIAGDPLNSLGEITTVVRVHLSWTLFLIL